MNYCIKCGNRLDKEDKFCGKCSQSVAGSSKKEGQDHRSKTTTSKSQLKDRETTKQTKKSGQSVHHTIEIPGVTGSSEVAFSDDSISYKNTTIPYTEIEGISCKQIYHSMNLVPTHQDFTFSFYGSRGRSINLSFGTTLHLGAKNRKQIFAQLYVISKEFFVPIIVRKLAEHIFDRGETIQIGSVYFNKHGYYKKKLFGLGGEDWVHWTDSVGEPDMQSGQIILYKAKDGEYKHFASVALETTNAIAIPDLILYLYASLKSN